MRSLPRQDLDGWWRRFKGEGCQQARARLIEHFSYLVVMTRDRIYPKRPWEIDVEDLLSCGFIGLITAVDKFDPTRGIGFETFAIAWVRGAMREWLRHEDWLPRSVREKQRQRAAAEQGLLERGEAVTPGALAAVMGMSAARFDRFQAEAKPRHCSSLDEVVRADEGDDLDPLYPKDALVDPAPGPDAAAIRGQEREYWEREVARLPSQARQVLRHRYQDELTLKAIAKEMGFSESRAHQLHREGLTILRHRDAVWQALGRR